MFWHKRKKQDNSKKDILELYVNGLDDFKERFEALPLEKKVAAIAVITSIEPSSKSLNTWLIENYSTLITATCREKITDIYPIEKAIELLKEEKPGIEARKLPDLEKTFQIDNIQIACEDVRFDSWCGHCWIWGDVYISVNGQDLGKEHTLVNIQKNLKKDLVEKFAHHGFAIKACDLEKITAPILSYYQKLGQIKELAETKPVWTYKDGKITEKYQI